MRRGSKHEWRAKDRLWLNSMKSSEMERWARYRQLGPAASAKRVVCVDDGLIFESASAAARHYKVAKSALIELCLNDFRRKTVGGRVFRYME